MIAEKDFAQLDIQGKKKVLLTIFDQLPIQSQEMHDVQDLLQLDFPYEARTLDIIFTSIQEIIMK